VAEPDGTDGENQRPDEKHDSIKPVALELAESPKPLPSQIVVELREVRLWLDARQPELSLRVGQLLRYSLTFALCFDL
jgi:hypothetical protein